jgi:hypothetical protein
MPWAILSTTALGKPSRSSEGMTDTVKPDIRRVASCESPWHADARPAPESRRAGLHLGIANLAHQQHMHPEFRRQLPQGLHQHMGAFEPAHVGHQAGHEGAAGTPNPSGRPGRGGVPRGIVSLANGQHLVGPAHGAYVITYGIGNPITADTRGWR